MWFQDETRIGQQGSTSRLWAKKGTRPRALKQQQFTYPYIYGAICPSTGQAAYSSGCKHRVYEPAYSGEAEHLPALNIGQCLFTPSVHLQSMNSLLFS